MKKLIFFACVSLALLSCKKETPLTPTLKESNSLEKQVAEVIFKADKNLYNKVYNHNKKAPIVDVKIIHGIFVAQQGDIASGTCLPHPTNPCMIIVSGKFASNTPTFNGIGVITGNQVIEFAEEDEACVIANTSTPVVQKPSRLKTQLNSNGNIDITVVN
jgi:hypothetical protein